jgi:N-acetylglucosamine-6-phosphate deacetylase
MDNQLGKIKSGFPASFTTFNDNLSRIEALNYNQIKTIKQLKNR